MDRDFAIKQAEHADNLFSQGIDHGLLQGIPVAIKDNIKTANMPTTMGSAFYKDYIPTENADCVELLKQAGAIIIGIVADWPEDFSLFLTSLIIKQGSCMITPKLTMELWNSDASLAAESRIPHNALQDAFALKRKYVI